LFFDFKRAAAYRDPDSHYGMRQTMASVKAIGESFGGFCIEAGLVDEWLTERGWQLIDHFTPKKLEPYVLKSTGAPLGRVTGFQDFAIAMNE